VLAELLEKVVRADWPTTRAVDRVRSWSGECDGHGADAPRYLYDQAGDRFVEMVR
jgi:hypothetical protein